MAGPAKPVLPHEAKATANSRANPKPDAVAAREAAMKAVGTPKTGIPAMAGIAADAEITRRDAPRSPPAAAGPGGGVPR